MGDIEDRLPRPLQDAERTRAEALLSDASAVVRNFTRRAFTAATTTEKIRPIGYRILLPQRPVTSVDAVSLIVNGETRPLFGWVHDGGAEVWLFGDGQLINYSELLLEWLVYNSPMAQVTYTHGFPEVPPDVVAVVASMVGRTLTAPGLGGVVSEAVGDYNYRLSDTAAQGTLTLTDSEKTLLKAYKRAATSTELRW